MELVCVRLWPPPLQIYLWVTMKVNGFKIPDISNLIKTLLDRSFKINNAWVGFDLDNKILKHFVLDNNFPHKIVERNVIIVVHV